MIILQGGRRSGKTTELIRNASATGAGIVCYGKDMANNIKYQAKELGYDVNVFTYNDIVNNEHLKKEKINKLYIDELPMFLNHLTKTNVELVTGDIAAIAFK